MVLYILYRQRAKRHYIGITSNIDMRLASHNRGGVRSTKAYTPWNVVYSEQYTNTTKARKRELFLKKNGRVRQELFRKIHTHGPIV